MREIFAIIRQDKVKETLEALSSVGVDSVTVHTVHGRGKQGGSIMEVVDPLMRGNIESVSKIWKFPTPSSMAGASTLTKPVFWVPKSLLDIVVSEVPSEQVVETIVRVNRSGRNGDGKIFLLPIENAVRIRTGETRRLRYHLAGNVAGEGGTVVNGTTVTRGGRGWTPRFVVSVDPERCIGCGRCFKACGRDGALARGKALRGR